MVLNVKVDPYKYEYLPFGTTAHSRSQWAAL